MDAVMDKTGTVKINFRGSGTEGTKAATAAKVVVTRAILNNREKTVNLRIRAYSGERCTGSIVAPLAKSHATA